MDEKKEDQDLVINSDGTMNSEDKGTSINVSVKTSDTTDDTAPEIESPKQSQEPELNEMSPPPETELTVDPEPQAEGPVEVIQDATSEAGDPVEVKQAPENIEDLPVVNKTNLDFDQTTDFPAPEAVAKHEAPAEETRNSTTGHNEKPHEHRNNKKIAAFVTIFVALILTGAVIYVFISAESNTQETTATNNATPQEETVATPLDAIDQTDQQIDDAVKSIDDTELSADTVSDNSLGLQ